jgi:hypothetical protein
MAALYIQRAGFVKFFYRRFPVDLYTDIKNGFSAANGRTAPLPVCVPIKKIDRI